MKIPGQIDDFRSDLKKSLGVLEKKYDVSIVPKTMRYEPDGSGFSFSTQITNNNLGGKAIEQHEFEKYCELFGFTKDDYKKKVHFDGKTYEFIGFKRNAIKNTCLIRTIEPNPKTYVVTSGLIKTRLK